MTLQTIALRAKFGNCSAEDLEKWINWRESQDAVNQEMLEYAKAELEDKRRVAS